MDPPTISLKLHIDNSINYGSSVKVQEEQRLRDWLVSAAEASMLSVFTMSV